MNERPVASPRAARLRELEDDPPEWLREAIGKPVTRNRSNGAAIVAWRRAALAIDDYWQRHGWSADDDALGPRPENLPAGLAHDRASRAASQVGEERARARVEEESSSVPGDVVREAMLPGYAPLPRCRRY